MRSKNIGYLPELDHLRLLAALLVLTFHWFHITVGHWKPLPDFAWLAAITEGYTGVSLFFVLSGFVFTLISFGKPRIDYAVFIKNRILRIAPLFVLVFMLAISLNRDAFRAADLLYIVVTNIGDPPTSKYFLTGAAWSISVEFTFYLVFPFLIRFEKGNYYLIRLLLLFFVIRSGVYVISDRSNLIFYSTIIGRIDQFLIGMLSALLYKRWSSPSWYASLSLLIISAIALVLALRLQAIHMSFFATETKHSFWILWPTVEAILWAAVVVGYINTAPLKFSKLSSFLAVFGSWSFSIYMWHALIIVLVSAIWPLSINFGLLDLSLHFTTVLFSTFLFAALSFYTVEKPFLDLRGHYVKSDPAAQGPASTP